MIVERLVFESFGAFVDVSVSFSPGFNLFFGRNEGGKSTLIDGLLLALLGAPAGTDKRRRYAPLDREEYRAVVEVVTSNGQKLRFERDLSPGGRDAVGIRDGDNWVVRKKADSVLKKLALPSFELARATSVVSGSEIVLVAREDARAVSRAISARVTRDEGAVTGQQALRRLDERRRALENKERRQLTDDIEARQRAAAAVAEAASVRRRLEEVRRQAEERLAAAAEFAATAGPAVNALADLERARKDYEDRARDHEACFKDLRAIKAREDEIARLEKALAPLAPREVALSGEALTRFHQLSALSKARREAAAENEAAVRRLQDELAVLHEQLEVYRRAGITPERQRELDRIDSAIALAEKNLAVRENALNRMKPPGGWHVMGLTAAIMAGAAGIYLGLTGRIAGWLIVPAACGAILLLLHRRRRYDDRLRDLREARQEALQGVEMARASFLASSGGRSFRVWLEEYAVVQRLTEEIRGKEALVQAKLGQTGQAEREEEELAALLQAAGCRSEDEYERTAAVWQDGRRRMAEAAASRDSLMRGHTREDWEAQETALARMEASAKAALAEAESAAAGLDPVIVARYREELAALDLPGLEKEALAAAAACAQHNESSMAGDPWEIETGLSLAEAALADNRRRAEAVRLAMETLGQAVAEVQGNLIPGIQNRAGRLFARLTGGRYDGLAVTSGPDLLEVQPRQGERILPGRILSSGTADQMYLALRLALIEVLQGPEGLPLILDDPFLTFDRPRLEHAMALLLELAAERQIILVTKDEFLRDWSAGAGVAPQQLPGGAASA